LYLYILSTCEVEGPVSVSRPTTSFGNSSVEFSGSTNTQFMNIYLYRTFVLLITGNSGHKLYLWISLIRQDKQQSFFRR